MQQKMRAMKRNPTLLTRQHASREKRMQHPGMRERTSRTPCLHLAREGHILLGRLDQRVDDRPVGRAVRSPASHGLIEGRWSSYTVLQFHYSYMSRTPWRSRALRSAVTFDLVRRNVNVIATEFAVEKLFSRFESAKCPHRYYFGTTATKSRTTFSSEMENALPFARLNQNALDVPPSRFRAR